MRARGFDSTILLGACRTKIVFSPVGRAFQLADASLVAAIVGIAQDAQLVAVGQRDGVIKGAVLAFVSHQLSATNSQRWTTI